MNPYRYTPTGDEDTATPFLGWLRAAVAWLVTISLLALGVMVAYALLPIVAIAALFLDSTDDWPASRWAIEIAGTIAAIAVWALSIFAILMESGVLR